MSAGCFRNRWLNQSSLLIFGIVALSSGDHLVVLGRTRSGQPGAGPVIPTGRIQVIQSTDGGTDPRILSREGDSVKKDQLLVELDEVKLMARWAKREGKVASLMSSMAQINAELFDRPLASPPKCRVSRLHRQPVAALQQAAPGAEGPAASLRQMLGLMQQELNMNMPLLEQGDVSRADVLRLQSSVSDIQSQIINVRNKYIQDLQAEYTKTEEDLVTAREMLAQRSDALKDTKIRAPVDGIVKNIRLTTVGGVLRPSDEVMSIVPTGEELILEAKMSPKDIAYVRIGQNATSSSTPMILRSTVGEGKVSYISPDTLTEQPPRGGRLLSRPYQRRYAAG